MEYCIFSKLLSYSQKCGAEDIKSILFNLFDLRTTFFLLKMVYKTILCNLNLENCRFDSLISRLTGKTHFAHFQIFINFHGVFNSHGILVSSDYLYVWIILKGINYWVIMTRVFHFEKDSFILSQFWLI